MTVTTRSDAELLAQARDGDGDALGELYVRHRPAALRVARGYGRAGDAEDLVNEAFERVLGAMRRGRGPADAFRPYLFVTIRRLASDRRATDHAPLDDVPEAVAAAADEPDASLADRALVAEAFADLPDRWQTVLWHTAVEGRRPRDVARAVGMPANTVAVLAHRARERLRQRYLQAHIGAGCPPDCTPYRARLGAHVRGGLTRRHGGAVEAHLADCPGCRRLADELGDVNRLLARAVVPAFVLAEEGGGALAGSLGTTAGAAGATTSGGAVAGSGPATTGAAAAGGGAVASSAALGAAGTAVGITVAKVAAAIVAVVGLVAVSPIDVGGGSDDPNVEAAGPGADEPEPEPAAATAPSAPATTVVTPPDPTSAGAAPGSPAPSDDAAIDLDARIDLGGGDAGVAVGLDVPLPVVPGGGVEAQVEAGLAEGVDIDAAWRAGVLGTGSLALDVANAGTDALVGAALVVDLSPGARPTSLLGTSCHATDPGLVGAVLSLLGSLTCDLVALAPTDAATLDLPLAVLGSGQTASVRLIAGGVEVASTTVDLARSRVSRSGRPAAPRRRAARRRPSRCRPCRWPTRSWPTTTRGPTPWPWRPRDRRRRRSGTPTA